MLENVFGHDFANDATVTRFNIFTKLFEMEMWWRPSRHSDFCYNGNCMSARKSNFDKKNISEAWGWERIFGTAPNFPNYTHYPSVCGILAQIPNFKTWIINILVILMQVDFINKFRLILLHRHLFLDESGNLFRKWNDDDEQYTLQTHTFLI